VIQSDEHDQGGSLQRENLTYQINVLITVTTANETMDNAPYPAHPSPKENV
jgi:hypothetical protein